jgi:ribonuclease HI
MQLAALNPAIEVIEYIINARKEESILMSVLIWSWWKERNRVRGGENPQLISNMARNIQMYVAEIQKMLAVSGKIKMNQLKKWKKPPAEFLKLNIDATFDPDGRNGGWGFILRDEDGDVVTAGCGKLDWVHDPLQAEVVACLQGTQAAIDLGVGKIIIETDALQVCQAMNSRAYDLSLAGNLIKELRSLAESNFMSFKFVHVQRSCNKVADALAARGRECVMGAEMFPGVSQVVFRHWSPMIWRLFK